MMGGMMGRKQNRPRRPVFPSDLAERESAGIELRTVAWRVNLAAISYEKRLS